MDTQYKHNWYVHDSMHFADMKAVPNDRQIAAYVNTGEIPFMYLQEGMKHQARVNPNYRQNNLPDGI